MKSVSPAILLIGLACIALCIAGCTTTTIGNPAPAQTSAAAAAPER